MIQKAHELVPPVLAKELLRLARLDRNWLIWVPLEPPRYICETKHLTWLRKAWKQGQDGFSMWALSVWLVDGPKSFRPNLPQCEAMEQIEVNVELKDYAQPFPAILVEFPKDKYAPFNNCLMHHSSKEMLTCSLHTTDNENDIITTISTHGGDKPIEKAIQTFDEDVSTYSSIAGKALRVAVNSCLALVNFGCRKELLFKRQAESDRKLAQEDSERGGKARERLKLAVSVVSFTQEVVLHASESREPSGEPTGREVSAHWRCGHWRLQHHGPMNSQTKRVLIKPVLVRADRFVGELADTSATYKG